MSSSALFLDHVIYICKQDINLNWLFAALIASSVHVISAKLVLYIIQIKKKNMFLLSFQIVSFKFYRVMINDASRLNQAIKIFVFDNYKPLISNTQAKQGNHNI